MTKIVAFHKPFNVVSQFRGGQHELTLSSFINDPSLRIAGRLDKDSEGLMLLSDDGQWIQHISHPRFKQPKTYCVQVEGIPSSDALQRLRHGVRLTDGMTLPAEVEVMDEPDWLWPRLPPIRYRATIPTAWLRLTIIEGRNRQIRRMTAAVDLPTLRLIRIQVGHVNLLDLGLAEGQSQLLDLAHHSDWHQIRAQGSNRPRRPSTKRPKSLL